MKVGYTTIMHEPRIRLQLTMNEYALLDLVYRLSTNPTAPVKGWCSMSKENLAVFLGVSKRTIITICNKLYDANYIEKSIDGRLYKTTDKWVENAVNFSFTRGEETSPKHGEETAPRHGEESSLYNNIYYNNKKENDKGFFATDYLSQNYPSRSESFLINYRSKLKDPDKCFNHFDLTVETEKLDYSDRVLFSRMTKYVENWISNEKNFTPKGNDLENSNKQTNPNNGTAI